MDGLERYLDEQKTVVRPIFSARKEGTLDALQVCQVKYLPQIRNTAVIPILVIPEIYFLKETKRVNLTLPLVPLGSQGHSRLEHGVYKHYKGRDYRLIFFANLTPGLEPVVVYQATYIDDELGAFPIFVRSLSEFEQRVEHEGSQLPRFKFLRPYKKNKLF